MNGHIAAHWCQIYGGTSKPSLFLLRLCLQIEFDYTETLNLSPKMLEGCLPQELTFLDLFCVAS